MAGWRSHPQYAAGDVVHIQGLRDPDLASLNGRVGEVIDEFSSGMVRVRVAVCE